jgi:hypothetical protein
MVSMRSKQPARKFLYEVSLASDRSVIVEAANSTQAKRKACKYWGYKPGDPWLGLSAIKARKISKKISKKED